MFGLVLVRFLQIKQTECLNLQFLHFPSTLSHFCQFACLSFLHTGVHLSYNEAHEKRYKTGQCII